MSQALAHAERKLIILKLLVIHCCYEAFERVVDYYDYEYGRQLH